MAAFNCSWCGKCCASFGEFITIERQLSSRDYYCRYGIKKELFLAHIEGDYTYRYPPDPGEEEPPKGCPFMRKNPAGESYSCVIYATRPRICRDFRCYRMLIHNRDGHECGRIIGHSTIKTADKKLEAIWKEYIVSLKSLPDTHWEKAVIAALAAHGYCGESVE